MNADLQPPAPLHPAAASDAEILRWQAYLQALQSAGEALDRARRIVPDHGLDHGMERIRALLSAGAAELARCLAAGAVGNGCTQD